MSQSGSSINCAQTGSVHGQLWPAKTFNRVRKFQQTYLVKFVELSLAHRRELFSRESAEEEIAFERPALARLVHETRAHRVDRLARSRERLWGWNVRRCCCRSEVFWCVRKRPRVFTARNSRGDEPRAREHCGLAEDVTEGVHCAMSCRSLCFACLGGWWVRRCRERNVGGGGRGESETARPTRSRHRAKHAVAPTNSEHAPRSIEQPQKHHPAQSTIRLSSVYTGRAVRIYKAIAFHGKVQRGGRSAVTCPT